MCCNAVTHHHQILMFASLQSEEDRQVELEWVYVWLVATTECYQVTSTFSLQHSGFSVSPWTWWDSEEKFENMDLAGVTTIERSVSRETHILCFKIRCHSVTLLVFGPIPDAVASQFWQQFFRRKLRLNEGYWEKPSYLHYPSIHNNTPSVHFHTCKMLAKRYKSWLPIISRKKDLSVLNRSGKSQRGRVRHN